MINTVIEDKLELFITDTILFIMSEYSGMAKRNAWYTFMETDYSFILLCGGL